jgi:hypothetical protein
MSGRMNECSSQSELEAEVILRKIIADFEQLDRAIDSAIAALKAGQGQAGDVEALERARKAVRKGATLAKSHIASD